VRLFPENFAVKAGCEGPGVSVEILKGLDAAPWSSCEECSFVSRVCSCIEESKQRLEAGGGNGEDLLTCLCDFSTGWCM
jgi:hypothetical protein